MHPAKLHSPSAERNLKPITAVILETFPKRGRILEIASGSGQHVASLAEALPEVTWQPSDPDATARRSITAWIADSGRATIERPLAIDISDHRWWTVIRGSLSGIVCINLLHIAPWAACLGLMRGASELLEPGGLLYLYGAYRRNGRHTALSNAAFDADLRRRNPAWGVRNLDEVTASARTNGLELDQIVDMPNNNLYVLFRRKPLGTRTSDLE